MKFLLLSIILSFNLAHAQKKTNMAPSVGGGGNGQLVVIPRGHKKPVPYEIAKSFDSGVYRNFYKLPGLKGNTERRVRFNKDYALYAVKWLEIIKGYSQGLYEDLTKAARTTRFRYLDNYILWEHQKYPAGEVDYKKYEKAAYYNGEIIVSTIVMDRLGDLKGYLSKEMNQGFVLVHELINAAYPSKSVKDKLDLGEMIANIKLLGWSKREFLTELYLSENFRFLRKESLELKLDILREVHEQEAPFQSLQKGIYNSYKFASMSDFLALFERFESSTNGLMKLKNIIRSLNYNLGEFTAFYHISKQLNLIDYNLEENIEKVFDEILYVINWKDYALPDLPRLSSQLNSYLMKKSKELFTEVRESIVKKFAGPLSLSNLEKVSFVNRFVFHGPLYGHITKDIKLRLFKLVPSMKYSEIKRKEYAQKILLAGYKGYIKTASLLNVFEASLEEFKNKNRIKAIYFGGIEVETMGSRSSTLHASTSLREKMGALQFLKPYYSDQKCTLEEVGLSFGERYLVKKVVDYGKIKLKVIASNNRARVGKVIKINHFKYELHVSRCEAIVYKR